MIFNSFTFIFICLIPSIILVILAEIWGGRHRIFLQNCVLTAFSVLFFAWSGTKHLKALAFLIFGNYIIGLCAAKYKKILISGIIFNLFILFYFKYLNLVFSTIAEIFHKDADFIEIFAPLGISFIVFQCISYLMDLYQETEQPCKDLLSFSLYIVFFPKLSQGPIVKFKDMRGQIQERNIEYNRFISGVERFIVGLSKKVLIADILSGTVNEIYYNVGIGMDAASAWLAVFCFAVQLYMDFSGYSDMAIGLSALFGFQFKENFDFPYLSISITEFWRKWHISLGAWFREYLYFPLGGSRRGNVYLNLFIVFLATGIWHGAAWVYLLWGMLHGVCIVMERYLMKKDWYYKIPVFIRWAGTFLIVNIGWIAFKLPHISECKTFFSYLFGKGT